MWESVWRSIFALCAKVRGSLNNRRGGGMKIVLTKCILLHFREQIGLHGKDVEECYVSHQHVKFRSAQDCGTSLAPDIV